MSSDNIYIRIVTDPESPCIKNYKPTRLYIKEHTVTGKKYFGKTVSSDLDAYLGSGHYWKDHIKKHGQEFVVNKWISEPFLDPVELQEFALAFSELNDIVESCEWANMAPENGLSGGYYGGWDHITDEHYAKMRATKANPEWKATVGMNAKIKELATKSDPVWKQTVWAPAMEKVSNAANARFGDKEWMATTYADGKRKELETKADPLWKATNGAEKTRKLIETVTDPEWIEWVGKDSRKRQAKSISKTLNDPVYRATKGAETSKRKAKTATGRRRTTVNGKLTWEYPDGNGGYVPFHEFKKLRENGR